MGRSLLVAKKEKLLILREKGIWWEKKTHDLAKMVFGLRHNPIEWKFFWVCVLAVFGTAPGNNRISVASGNCQSCYLSHCSLLLFVITFLHLPTFFMNKHTYFFLGSLNFKFSTKSENSELPTSPSWEKVVHQDRNRKDGVSTDSSLKSWKSRMRLFPASSIPFPTYTLSCWLWYLSSFLI